MTLGCGGWGGNITSDNISPRHLLNIKRLAWELRPSTTGRTARPAATAAAPAAPVPAAATALPKAPSPPVSLGLDAADMSRQLAAFAGAAPPASGTSAPGTSAVVDFVCEEDVRQAIWLNRKILIGERTIVTPSARDLANAHRVFITETWPR
jgi:acetaldehyde dehydrogenase (acetylating)